MQNYILIKCTEQALMYGVRVHFIKVAQINLKCLRHVDRQNLFKLGSA